MSDQTYPEVVTEAAENLIDEMRDEFKEGTTGKSLREAFQDRLWENCDGHDWVIYTALAKQIVCESKNSGAYIEMCGGSDGVTEGGDLAWSRLAYAALEQDILEELSRIGFDPNDPEAYFDDEESDNNGLEGVNS